MKRLAFSRYRALLGAFGLAAVLVVAPASADEESERKADVAAAEDEATHWLDALDAGRTEEGWNHTASVMKESRNQQEWTHDVVSSREALGKSVTRELQRTSFATTVRGAPQGKYVTVVYLTKFAHAPVVNETILVMFEADHWRIAGYSIDRAPEPPAPSPTEGKPAPSGSPKPKG
jgi:hypothetical protein